MSDTLDEALPQSARWLGYGGLLPFVGLSLLVALEPTRQPIWTQALMAYGAVILSFVGALHWAFAMVLRDLSPSQRRHRYIWSTIPALVAWPALLLPTHFAVLLLVAGFAAHYLQDRRLADAVALPAWYLPLRLRLSAVASLALMVAASFTPA